MSTTRGYISDDQYQVITGGASLGGGVTAERIINQAEAIIDGFIGNWQPYLGHIKGVATSGTVDTLQMSASDAQQLPGVNYLKGCVVELLSGTNEGLYRVIAGQLKDGQLTFDLALPAVVATGDIYHIYQMGKVPRRGKSDFTTLNDNGTTIYVRSIPGALREAVAWQIKYMQELGDEFFNGAALNMQSESFGKYSYQRSDSAKGAQAIVAPRAKDALAGTGLINRTAHIVGY